MTLSDAEQKKLDTLRTRYANAGGDPDDPFDEKTMPGIDRGEHSEQPDDSINPEQIKELRDLHRQSTAELIED
ncbi:hypothetical protein ACFLZH_03375 [Patescibacteria group bacterium]